MQKKYAITIATVLTISGLAIACAKEPVVHEGSVDINRIEDIEKYAKYTHIEGDLDICLPTSPNVVSFPNLVAVSGNITMWSSAPEILKLDRLRTVGKTFRLAANEHLTEVHVPNLRQVDDLLAVMSNWKLTVLNMESLERVGDKAVISMNKKLSTCEIAKLGKGLTAGMEVFYYYANKPDGCNDHPLRFSLSKQ